MITSDEIPVNETLKGLLILITHGNIYFTEHNAAAFNDFDALKVNDKGAVNPHKTVGRQLALHLFHGRQGQYRFVLSMEIDFHIILQTFDILNVR